MHGEIGQGPHGLEDDFLSVKVDRAGRVGREVGERGRDCKPEQAGRQGKSILEVRSIELSRELASVSQWDPKAIGTRQERPTFFLTVFTGAYGPMFAASDTPNYIATPTPEPGSLLMMLSAVAFCHACGGVAL